MVIGIGKLRVASLLDNGVIYGSVQHNLRGARITATAATARRNIYSSYLRADRVVVINDGKKLLDGAPREVFTKTDILRGAGLSVPQTTMLMEELRKYGYALPSDALTPEEGASAIASILAEKEKVK